MNRVVYTNTPATADQEALRRVNQVRIVADAEEGAGVNTLPGGVYGFTYSPGLPSAPLFATRRYCSYEIHKLTSGDIFIVGFADSNYAAQVSAAEDEVTVQIQPEPDQDATVLVQVPYSRMRQHRQHAAPNQHGFSVTVTPSRERHRLV